MSTLTAAEDRRLQANLCALRTRQPAVARRLEAAQVPAGVTSAGARDGSDTFRIAQDDGPWHWLGRTSMPRVRAAALVDTLAPDGSNVLVSPIAGGAEVWELLRRSPRHATVFVYDSDPVAIRLALSLTDFATCIRSGRLVILYGDDPCDTVAAFFAEQGGYEFPRRMLVPPYVDAPATESLRAAMERAHLRVERSRAQCLAGLSRSLATHRSDGPDVRRLVVLSIDPRPATIDAARALRSAAQACGVDSVDSVPDRPQRCHSMARIQSLAEHRADAAIIVNGGWGPLLDHVPPSLPSATWFLPGAAVVEGLTGGFHRRHVVFAATDELARAAVNAGVASDRVHRLEIGCDDRSFHPFPVSDRDVFDVACVGDAADLEPDACGIELTTQKDLWNEIRRHAVACPDDAPVAILEVAERGSGVTLDDDTTRDQFLTLIRARLLPTLIRRAAVETLLDADIDVRVFGDGWQHTDLSADRVRPTPDTPAHRNAVYNAAHVVVIPHWDSATACVILEVVLAGGCVVCRRPSWDITDRHPQLHDALHAIPMFDSPRALRKLVRTYLRDDDACANACARARNIIAEDHLTRHRVATILRALAESGAAS